MLFLGVKRFLIIAGCGMILVAAVLFVFVTTARSVKHGPMSVLFLSFTNDATGQRLASFVISNGSSWSFGCFGRYSIELPEPKAPSSSGRLRRNNIFTGDFTNGGFTLHPGESRVITVQAPTNQASWRVNLTGREDRGVLVEMGRELLVEARKLGVPMRYRPTLYGVSSDFVNE